MVRISITIHDLDVSNEQLSAILEGKVEVALNQTFTCDDCGDTFSSQASVNSHKKNCKVRKAAEEKAKAKEAEAKAKAKAKAKAEAEAKRKAEEEAKKLPSFPGFKDNELEKAVLTVVIECTGAPTTAHSIEEAIWKDFLPRYEQNQKLKSMRIMAILVFRKHKNLSNVQSVHLSSNLKSSEKIIMGRHTRILSTNAVFVN